MTSLTLPSISSDACGRSNDETDWKHQHDRIRAEYDTLMADYNQSQQELDKSEKKVRKLANDLVEQDFEATIALDKQVELQETVNVKNKEISVIRSAPSNQQFCSNNLHVSRSKIHRSVFAPKIACFFKTRQFTANSYLHN